MIKPLQIQGSESHRNVVAGSVNGGIGQDQHRPAGDAADVIITDSEIAGFNCAPKPWLIAGIGKLVGRNRTAINLAVGFCSPKVGVAPELLEKIGAKRIAFGRLRIFCLNKFRQSDEDLTGTLKYMFFLMGDKFSQLQDISLNPGDRQLPLLGGGIHDHSPGRNHGNQNEKYQANAQRFKVKKFHCFKLALGLSQ
ncbi:MAG: hypothetical protein JSW39_27525 [Desulfobacterales bacterium]|nr:MAG: hypothetical protein JSW39_27525 [Desulfobacterales bacterium]